SCELPQGRKAARVSELCRVHGESSIPQHHNSTTPLIPRLPRSALPTLRFWRRNRGRKAKSLILSVFCFITIIRSSHPCVLTRFPCCPRRSKVPLPPFRH